MLTKTHPPTASPPIVAVLSKTRHALVALALLFIAPPLYADTFTSCSDVTQMPEAQCNTLVALYDNTAGANWSNNTGWKQTDTPCSWFGVTCSGGEVTQISLSSNQLTGPIPSLNTLTSLQTLNITGNQLCQDSNANYAGWTEVDEFPSCDDPNYGLILHLLFDGNANDASGNSHNGIENQVNYVPGVNGQAAYFDGNEAYVKILDHDALDANDSMTLSLWIKPEQLNAQNGSWIISKWCSSGPVCSPDNTPKGDWGLRTGIPSNSENTDDILFFVQNYPEYQASAIAKAKSVLSVDTWQHVVATFDKGVQKLYLNGQLLKETTSSLTHLSKEEYDTDDIFIGKIWLLEDNKYNYTGAVDELFIYNRALSASEILSHYDSTKPATSETVLEDAEDGDTQGWSISANPQGDSAFANVVDSEKDSRVIELTGNSRSTYKFVFPDGSPLSTNNFIARWDLKMATGFGTVFWRVETTGSVIYMEYRLNTPLGCHLSSKSTYAICGLGDMQENTWYTITRDFKADLKAVGLDIELQSVEYLLIYSAGRVDNIQLLKEMPPIDCNTVTEIPTAQCEALVALYDSTDGDNWTNNDGWKTTDTPCSWYGVSCENGVVTTIDLDDNNLTGTLPDWSVLTSLQELLLGHNKITETVPELSNLTNLKVLSLKYNDLSGAIPELSHLSQLTTLWLEGNNLIGSIPDLSGLSSLTGMSLAANQLSGEIPDLSGLTSAHSIYLGDNQLTGSIPDLSRVTHLWNFSVANNQLSGEIPSLASLPKLESFDLTGDNKLCRNTEADYAGRTEVDAFPVCGTQAPEPVIAISEPQEQSDGLAVSFDASGSTDSDPDGQITSYTWITSDGQIFPGVNPTITFSEPGEQTVTLIIADNTGKTTAVEQTITVAKPLEILSLTITKRGTGKGEFHSTAPDTAIDCDIDCQRAKNDYNSDIVVTLQATPAPGSIFTSWGNGCGGTSNPTTVTMNRQKYCTATFDLDPAQRQLHRFRIAKIGDGSGRITVKQDNDIITKCSSADCEAKYFPSGTELALTVNIADDATFVGWSEDCHGTEPSITVTIEHATKCTAELALRPPEPIERRLTVATAQETVSPSQGTVTSQGIECGNGNNGSDDCVENYPHGQQLWLKAAPAPHSYFKEWTDDCSGTGSATTLIMDTDKTCTAIFGSDSDTNANDMVKTFLDECQLSNGEQFTDTYPPFNNEHRLEETYRLIENVMTKIKEHLVLTGSWPHQLHGIEWYLPLPSYLYTKSIQVISGGTTVKQANGIEEYVEGNYLKVEVLLITETGTEEIMPILISPEQAPPESSSTMRRGGGYCWWWYRPWRR